MNAPDRKAGGAPPTRDIGRFGRAVQRMVLAVTRAPRVALLAAVALTAISGAYSVRTLEIDTDTAGMISEDLPFRRLYKEFGAAFPGLSDNVAIVIEADIPDRADAAAATIAGRLRSDPVNFPLVLSPETDPFFLRNGLLYLDLEELEKLAADLADAQALLTSLAADPSLRGLAPVMADAIDGIDDDAPKAARFARVLERFAAVAETAGGSDPRALSWQTLIADDAAPPAAPARRIVVTRPLVDFSSLSPAAEAMERIRGIARDAGLTPENGVRVRLTGGVVISTEELASVTEGARTAGLISLVLVSLLLAWGIRSGRIVAAILVALLMGLVWTAGFTAVAVGQLNLVSVAFAVLFIGLGVDFGIHFGLRFREERFGPGSQTDALRRATGGLSTALGLCAAAAAIAFLSFVPTDYRGLSELGLIAGAGMFIALIATFWVVPAMLAILPPRIPAGMPEASTGWLPDRRVAIAALALGAGAAALLPFARFDFDPIKLRDPATESVRTFRDLAASPGASPYTIEVMAPMLADGRALAARLERLEVVDKAVTAADLVPARQDDKLAVVDDLNIFLAPLRLAKPAPPPDAAERARAFAALRATLARGAATAQDPKLREAAAGLDQALAGVDPAAFERAVFAFFPLMVERLRTALDARRVTLEDLPPVVRDRYLSATGKARVQVYPVENLEDQAALRTFVQEVRAVAPGATDSPVEIFEAGRTVVRSVVTAAAISVVTVTLMLLALFRSARDTLLVLVPLVLAALYTVALTVILGWPFNFANVIVLPLLMGLGVASGIHLVARAREEASGRRAFASATPRAVVFSALTTIASFGSLAVSSHRGTASMGELLTLSIAVTLVCTLVVLPALMRLWPARGRRNGNGG